MIRASGHRESMPWRLRDGQRSNTPPELESHGWGGLIAIGDVSSPIYCRTTRVTRRFMARPSGLELSAIGAVLPYEMMDMR